MKRMRLSAKLALAIIPISLVALLTAGFVAYTFLGTSEQQNETAHAATVTSDAIATLDAVWSEESLARRLHLFGDDSVENGLNDAMARTDEAFDRLEKSVRSLQSASQGFFSEVANSAAEDVQTVGRNLDRMRAIAAPDETEILGYHDVADSILSLLPRSSSIVSDRLQSRELSTAYFLAEGGQISLQQEQLIAEFRAATVDADEDAIAAARAALQPTLEVLEDEFGAWALRANQTANQMNAAILRYTRLPQVNIDTFPVARNENILTTSEELADGVATESDANAVRSEREAYLVAGIAAIVLLLAIWGSYAVIRSVVRRVRGVTKAAIQVSEVDLPNLVDALQNPNEDIKELKPTEISSAGYDEVGDLAQSFTALHATLIDVASQQMDILRKGVSEIFVTLARRNRSLVDRQLALLDELESREEDPETLGGYYKLDHLSTRMRRNAESLLVLAGTEPTRIWSNPLDVSEIIRAALGEVDDYQRVDILALEPALVSGRAVADIAHLMSELLDNGTQYSSPADRVRVSGLFDPEGYMLTVSDSGIGVSGSRLADLNTLLESPPVLGLALEPTLGMYVVARLAARHGIKAQLISGSPGLTVRVLLPKTLIENARSESAGAPEPSAESPILDPSELRPTLATPSSATVPEPVASSNGLAPGHSIGGRRIPPVGDRPSSRPRPSIPGNIKGKHEQVGRPEAVEPVAEDTAIDAGEPAPHATPADASSPLGLARRVPGEALRASNPHGFNEPDDKPRDEATNRATGEAIDWSAESNDLPRVESDDRDSLEPIEQGSAETSSANVEPAPPATPSDSPWWAAASDQSTKSEVEADSTEAKDPSPFEFWDNDFSESSPSQSPAPEPAPPALSGAGLPVRTPGTSFTETDDTAFSAAVSESGAMGIRSALSSFEGGRELAQKREEDETDDPEGTQQ